MYEGKDCIVRCKGAGVFFATIKEWEPASGVAVLNNARRLWFWRGASECIQLAQEGTNDPKGCKFTMAIPEITVANVLEVAPCSKEAAQNLNGVPAWKA